MFYELSKNEKIVGALVILVCCIFEPGAPANPEVKIAGISLIVGIIGAAVFTAAAAFAFLQKPPEQDGMEPQTLDSFGMTQAKEGTPVPILYGLNRVPGNLLYYGNLRTYEIYQKVKGGKGGGGSSEQLVGYEYRLDVWQSVGLTSPGASRIELIGTYIDDEPATPEVATTTFNNGTSAAFPSFVPKGGKLPNVAHVGYEAFFLGENRTTLPVVHFITKTYLSTGIANENVDDGNNPAAVIYDLLILSRNVEPADVDFTSFETAAAYWHSVGYACSMKIGQVKEIYQVINQILQIFPGILYPNSAGKLVLRAFDPNDAAQWTIGHNDHKELKFQRQTYIQMNNDFSAKYVDKNLDYTERHVGAANDAVVELTGERKPANFDLSFMRTSAAASRRIDELMKNESYPKAVLQFSVNLKYLGMQPGDVIAFSNTRLGISNLYLRATSVSRPGIADGDIKIKAVQMTERLFDANFIDTFESTPSSIGDQTPDAEIRDFFEFPYNPVTEFEPVRVFVVERVSGIETGFDVGYSPTRTPTAPATELEYTTIQRCSSFSMRGTLTQAFAFDNYLDNTLTGLEFQPDVTYYPEFDSEQLQASYSSNTRFLLIDSEILTFATVAPVGGGVFRFTGLQRGVFGSEIKNSYPSGTKILVFNVLDNILNAGQAISNLSRINVTALFAGRSQQPPLDEFDTMNDGHSTMPGIPCYFKLTKTGTNFDYEVFTTVNANNGFGRGTPNTVIPRSTIDMPPNGKIRVFYDKDIENANDFTTPSFSDTAPTSGAVEVNMQIIETRDGKLNKSQCLQFAVLANDGVYEFNTRSKWSRKIYHPTTGEWLFSYIGAIAVTTPP